MTKGPRTAHGFSLVEMMIAMVVLSLGMLGIANLFVMTLQANSSATSRQLANNLLGDIADRIRANRTALAAYAAAGANYNCAGQAIGAVSCTPAQMAANDIYLWQQMIASTWPNGLATGKVAVAVNAGAPSTYTITITWQEPGNTSALSSTLVVQI